MTTKTPTSEAGSRAAFSVALGGMRVLEASPAFERMAGSASGALVGRSFDDLWPSSERAAIAARMDDVVIYGRDSIGALALVRHDGTKAHVVLDARYSHRDGERIEIEVEPLDGPVREPGPPPSPPPSEAPSVPLANSADPVTTDPSSPAPGTVADGDDAPAPDAARAFDLLEAAGVGALAVDRDGLVVGSTAPANKILGRSGADLVGRPIQGLFIFEETMVGVLGDARVEGRRQQLKAGARGGSVHAALVWMPGGPDGAGTLLIREMQPEDETTDRLRRQVTLADAAAHDARNALDAMAYGFATLRERMADEPDMIETIDNLDEGRARVRAIIDGHMAAARGGSGVSSAFDLATLLRGVIARSSSAARHAGVELWDDLIPDIIVVMDAGRLSRSIENLIENALRAMPEGGTLTLRTRVEDRDRPGARLEIVDTGIGMDAAVRARIFDRGYTTGDGRRGLGLPSVQDFVVGAGGEIDCVSAPGRGSRFIIWLPRREG